MLLGGYNTLLLLILPLILAIYAQSKVRSTYARYSRVAAQSRLTGAQAASQILQTGGAGEVNIEKVAGQLTDHYDPRKKVLRLSEAVHDTPPSPPWASPPTKRDTPSSITRAIPP